MDTDGGKLLPIGTTTGDLINKQNKRVDMDARNHTLPPMDHARKDKPESSNCSTYCSKKYNAREQQNQICCDIEVFQCSEQRSSGDSGKFVELNEDINQGDGPIVEDQQGLTPNQKQILDLESRVLEQMFEDCPYKYLLFQTHTWEEKVVRILHVVRRREFTERNPKTGICQPYRFSLFNIAFFDFDKECEYMHIVPFFTYFTVFNTAEYYIQAIVLYM